MWVARIEIATAESNYFPSGGGGGGGYSFSVISAGGDDCVCTSARGYFCPAPDSLFNFGEDAWGVGEN